jgi:hypothetical protein
MFSNINCKVLLSLCYNTLKHNGNYIYQLFKIQKLRGFSPQANYTDRTTAACRQN